MTVPREPLFRWKYPRAEILKNEEFASGKPSFAPFPSITNLLNVALCPVAAYHDLIHGLDKALVTGDAPPFSKRGELFQRFIAYLKVLIKNQELEMSRAMSSISGTIQERFVQFARNMHFPLSESNDIWQLYIEPWVRRKLQSNELQSITSNDHFFFEISVANSRLRVQLEGGIRNYPLHGRIDEINIGHKRIIERTIKAGRDNNNPPLLKDYQLWLLWKLLSSIRHEHLPELLKNEDFEDFKLIIETPDRDYIVTEDQEFINNTHSAYAWINDMSTSEAPGVFREVFENAQCSPEVPHSNCGHVFNNCFPRRLSYPQSRPEMRRTFQPWYRLLLWEQMWKGHLWYYQLLELPRDELLDLGLLVESRVLNSQGDQITLEVYNRTAQAFRGYEYCTLILNGTVFCGMKFKTSLVDARSNQLTLELNGIIPEISEDALLLISPDITAPIIQEPITFLDQQLQASLFRLTKKGATREDRARIRSDIQHLEAVFGTRRISRG